jgi:hypothetical protein
VKPADGLYDPFPVTFAVPTVVPAEQSDGAEDSGPNTLKVTDPDGDAPSDKPTDTDELGIAEPADPEPGAETDNDGEASPTTVSAINPPHVDAAALLSASPP